MNGIGKKMNLEKKHGNKDRNIFIVVFFLSSLESLEVIFIINATNKQQNVRQSLKKKMYVTVIKITVR